MGRERENKEGDENRNVHEERMYEFIVWQFAVARKKKLRVLIDVIFAFFSFFLSFASCKMLKERMSV
jgi:hypothetical protein